METPHQHLIPKWRETMHKLRAFFQTCEQLARIILRIFAMALKLERNTYFDEVLTEQVHTLRLLHYPPLSKDTAELAQSSAKQCE